MLVTPIDHWSQGPIHLWVGVGEQETPGAQERREPEIPGKQH